MGSESVDSVDLKQIVRRLRGVCVVLEEDQWKDVKDLLDAGFEKLEQDKEDKAYREQLLRTWSSLREQMAKYNVKV